MSCRPLSLGCLESWMVACEFRNGSGIERVLAEGIEVLISAEKLRGTHLCLDEIGAPARARKRLWGSWLVEIWSVRFVRVGRDVPCGPPCRARLDLVIYLFPILVWVVSRFPQKFENNFRNCQVLNRTRPRLWPIFLSSFVDLNVWEYICQIWIHENY